MEISNNKKQNKTMVLKLIIIILGVVLLLLIINIIYLNNKVHVLNQEIKKDNQRFIEYEEKILESKTILDNERLENIKIEDQLLETSAEIKNNQEYIFGLEKLQICFEDAIRKYYKEGAEVIAYLRLLSGDFSLLEADENEYKETLVNNYQSGAEEWTWVIMDLNNDGIKELFLRRGEKPWTAILWYKGGKISIKYMDSNDATEYHQPLENGTLLYTSAIYGTPSGDWENYKVEEFTEQGEIYSLENYVVLTVDWEEPLEYHRKRTQNIDNGDNMPPITEYGTYYLRQQREGDEIKYVFLTSQERNRLEDILDKKLEENEWQSLYLSETDRTSESEEE